MMILALEFSTDRRSVALARGDVVLAEAVQHTGARETDAFGLIEKVLTTTGASREQIATIAIGLGPGSYTGIRAAIALAQGWQLARGVKLLGVSSVVCLAIQAQEERIFGRVNVIIDAQRGEFYRSTWEISAKELQEVSPLKIVPASEIQAFADDIYVGPQAGRTLFPAAATAARLAASPKGTMGGNLEPIYLREASFVKAAPPRAV